MPARNNPFASGTKKIYGMGRRLQQGVLIRKGFRKRALLELRQISEAQCKDGKVKKVSEPTSKPRRVKKQAKATTQKIHTVIDTHEFPATQETTKKAMVTPEILAVLNTQTITREVVEILTINDSTEIKTSQEALDIQQILTALGFQAIPANQEALDIQSCQSSETDEEN